MLFRFGAAYLYGTKRQSSLAISLSLKWRKPQVIQNKMEVFHFFFVWVSQGLRFLLWMI